MSTIYNTVTGETHTGVDIWRAFPTLYGVAKPEWPKSLTNTDGDVCLINPTQEDVAAYEQPTTE